MITNNISLILYITGGLTATMLVQFLFPQQFLRIANKVELDDPVGLFYARHWGMVVFAVGMLVMYMGYNPAGRTPVLIAVTAEKLAFVGMIFTSLDKPLSKALIPAAIFDTICSVLYILFLTGVA